jgi:hypothetical protein
MTQSRRNARPKTVRANDRGRRGRSGRNAKADPGPAPGRECVCSFGATRVGPMIERVRLHVTTDRFLAGRRGDKMWEAACDYAALALARLESRLRPTVLTAWICATAGTGCLATGAAARVRRAIGGRR